MLLNELQKNGWAFDPFLDWPGELSRFFSGIQPRSAGAPPVNIWANDDEAVVSAEIPGVDPGEVEISLSGKTLHLEVKRAPEELGEGDRYLHRELDYGTFERSVNLPFDVEQDQVEARVKHGLLIVKLPRKESHKPRKIEIQN